MSLSVRGWRDPGTRGPGGRARGSSAGGGEAPAGQGRRPRIPGRARVETLFWLVVLVLLYIWSSEGTQVSLIDLWEGLDTVGRMLGRMWPADWGYLPETVGPLLETLRLALLGTTLGAILAVPLSFLSARNVAGTGWAYQIARAIMNLIRSIPDLVWAALLVPAVGIGPTAGVLALTLFSTGIVAKLVSESVEAIDPGPLEALDAVGASRLARIVYAVVPQVLPHFIAYTLFMFEINLRTSTVLGLVGAGGIGSTMMTQLTFFRYDRLMAIVVMLFVLVVVVDWISTRWRQRLVEGAPARAVSDPVLMAEEPGLARSPAGTTAAVPAGAAVGAGGHAGAGAATPAGDPGVDPGAGAGSTRVTGTGPGDAGGRQAGTSRVSEGAGTRAGLEPPRRPWWRWVLALGILAALYAWAFQGVRFALLGDPGPVFRGLFSPNWDYAGKVFEGVAESLQIAFLGTLIASLVAVPFGFLAARNVASTLAVVGKGLLDAIRTFPELVLAIIFMAAVGPSPFAGVLAVGFHSIGTVGKLYSEAVEAVDREPIEALQAVGASPLMTFWHGVLPQVLPEFLSYALYRFEINIRAATVVGVIGAGGIGTSLIFNVQLRNWENVGMVLVGILATVLVVDAVSSRLRGRLV
ncbi:phosphonate ABC transporter, permease protein PhnE [Thermaerobacter sp. PB12/4term]|uniref:phosphonate ABC transporter, permease protein PhnE n=1 Tax=Thermaerobacter sp. PB12/4term TaxID=2293838 RepID=UPI000E32B4CB|nr:phosphonate ABC transporter, permease protein PhnE [Thermaerobacter sp. PB12/4term]QIA27861.1 phosphonate ABC transporter, permease protein PhnE [Thermaerobacter sp. PB12/4term]